MTIDLESTVGNALGGDVIVPPAVQRQRDDQRVKILQDERAKELTNPDIPSRTANLKALDTELRGMGVTSAAPVPANHPAGDLLDTVSAAMNQPAPKPAEPKPTIGDTALDTAKTAFGATLAPAKTALEVVGSQASGVGQAILGGWRGLATLASGGSLDEAVRQTQNPELAGGMTARAYEPAPGSTAETVNKVVGLPGEALGYIGRKAGEAVMDHPDITRAVLRSNPMTALMNIDPAVVATAVDTGVNAIPLALIKSGKKVPAVQPRALPAPAAAAITDATNYDVPTYLRRQQPEPVRAAANEAPIPQATTEGVKPVEMAEKFEEVPAPATGSQLPAAEQARRAQVLKDIGLTGEARKSALAGDQVAANTEANAAKLENDAGRVLKSQLDNERAALTGYAENIVRDTGGSAGTDSGSLYARGNTILAPLEGLKTYFKDQIGALYDEARAKGAGQPVTLDGFGEELKKNSNFTGNTDTLQLREGIKDRMKELGMMDKEGNILPSTVDQAENLRKYIGEQWTKNSNSAIRSMKNRLDLDVTGAAGEDTFAKARQLHQMKAVTLDDPKGIAKVLDSDGPNGINRAVDIEKIANTITSMPSDQLAHIVKTLQNVPPELKPQAQTALSEIKAHFANKVLEAGSSRVGQWGARDVTKYLNNNAQRMAQVFSPDELAKFRTLHEAGNILDIKGGYPGAAVQEHNVLRALGAKSIRSLAAGAGSLVGSLLGPAGTAAGATLGDLAGGAITRRVDAAAGVKAAKDRMVKLADFPK